MSKRMFTIVVVISLTVILCTTAFYTMNRSHQICVKGFDGKTRCQTAQQVQSELNQFTQKTRNQH